MERPGSPKYGQGPGQKNETLEQNASRRGLKRPNICASSPSALSSVNAGAPPPPSRCWPSQTGPALGWKSLVLQFHPCLLQTHLTTREFSDVKDYQGGCQPNTPKKRENLFEKNIISISRGFRASPSDPTIVSPSGFSSAFISVPSIPSNSTSFCACNTSHRKGK